MGPQYYIETPQASAAPKVTLKRNLCEWILLVVLIFEIICWLICLFRG